MLRLFEYKNVFFGKRERKNLFSRICNIEYSFALCIVFSLVFILSGSTGWAEEIPQPLGEYTHFPVTIQPDFPEVPVEEDFTNVINTDQFTLSQEAMEMLERNGFVVVPSWYQEFFPVYQFNSYDLVPNFITTDSLLHNVHLMFSHLLRSVEEKYFISTLQSLSHKMLAESIKLYVFLAGTEWENAARRNIGYFALGNALLDPGAVIPEMVRSEVEEELALIAEREGITESPVMNMFRDNDIQVQYPGGVLGLLAYKEDYSQYIPRGHYERTEDFQRYFQAMMWYGRITFRFQEIDEIRSAVLMTLLLSEKDNEDMWTSLYDPVSFLVGVSDDITYTQFSKLITDVYDDFPQIEDLLDKPASFEQLVNEARRMDPPRINSIPIFDETIQPDRDEAIQGFRFLGQRFTVDADIFQRLVYRDVMENTAGERRMLPSGLDIPAAFGSDEALSILEEMNATEYEGYTENMNILRKSLAELPQETWTQNFYWSWMYSLLPLTYEKGEGYPSFMRNRSWYRKELTTFLGSFAELKHDTVLYAKQVYAQLGGMMPEERDDRGFVEPNPELYGRVASLLRLIRDGLDHFGFLDPSNAENLSRLEELSLILKTISEKQLIGELPTEEEFDVIRYYGGSLEHFWLEALRDEGIETISQLSERPGAIITDVATDPGGRVLQVGTGNVFSIYVLVPVDETLRIAKGGVYSYYEFPWPMQDRLTNSRWHEMLAADELPDPPEWTADFISYQKD